MTARMSRSAIHPAGPFGILRHDREPLEQTSRAGGSVTPAEIEQLEPLLLRLVMEDEALIAVGPCDPVRRVSAHEDSVRVVAAVAVPVGVVGALGRRVVVRLRIALVAHRVADVHRHRASRAVVAALLHPGPQVPE